MPAANNNAAYTKLVAVMKDILAPATREKVRDQVSSLASSPVLTSPVCGC